MEAVTPRNDLNLIVDLPNYAARGEEALPVAERTKSLAFRKSLRAISFVCEEGINQLYRLEIVVSMDGSAELEEGDLDDAPLAFRAEWVSGRSETLRRDREERLAGAADGRSRCFFGRVVETEFLGGGFARGGRGEESGTLYYRLVVRPNAWYLTQSVHTRVFTDSPVKSVLKDVLDAFGEESGRPLSYDMANLRDDDPLNGVRDFVHQRGESDYDFFLRWMERQGWHFRFVFEDVVPDADGLLEYREEKLALASDNVLDKVSGGADQFTGQARGSAMGMGVSGMSSRSAGVPRQVRMTDHDPENPSRELVAAYPEKPRDRGLPVLTLRDEFYEEPSEGTELCKARMEAFECRRTLWRGLSTLPGFVPGRTFLLRHRFGAPRSGRTERDEADGNEWTTRGLFIVSARHEAGAALGDVERGEVESFMGAAPRIGYSASFECASFEKKYRPLRTIGWPKIAGGVNGWVLPLTEGGKEGVTLDGRYYLRLDGVEPFATVALGSGSTNAVRRTKGMVGGIAGEFSPMRVGTEVMVSFRNGNPDRPFIVGPIGNADTDNENPSGRLGETREDGSGEYVEYDELGNLIQSWVMGDGKTDIMTLSSQAASTMMNVNSTVSSVNSLMLNATQSALGANFMRFMNVIGATNDLAIPNIMESLFDVVKTGLTGTSMYNLYKQNHPDAAADANMTAAQKQDAKDAANSQKFAIVNVSKTLSLVKTLMMFLQASSYSTAKSRVTLAATPVGGTLVNVGVPVDLRDKIMMFVSYALKITNSALAVIEAQQKRVTLNDSSALTYGNSAKAWKYTSLGFDVTNAIIEALVLVKLIYHACRNQGPANNGVVIVAKEEGKSNPLTALKNAAKGMLVGQKGKFVRNEGLNIRMLADGPIVAASDKSLSFYTGSRPAVAGPALPAATATTVAGHAMLPDEQKSVLELTGVGASGGAEALLHSRTVLVEGATISVSASTDICYGVTDSNSEYKSGMSMDDQGRVNIGGAGDGRMTFDGSVNLVSIDNSFIDVGDGVAIGAFKKGIILGVFDGGKKLKAGAPFVSINSDGSTYDTLRAAELDVSDKGKAYMRLKGDREGIVQQLTSINHAITYADQIQALATLAEARRRKIELESQLASKDLELLKAVQEWLAAKEVREQARQANMAASELTLCNGDGKKQKICLTRTDVTCESDKKVLLKVGTGATITISDNKLEFKASSNNMKVDGTKITLA